MCKTLRYPEELFVCLGIVTLCGIFANRKIIERAAPENERI